MKRYLRLIAIACLLGLVFGGLSAVSDYWYGQFGLQRSLWGGVFALVLGIVGGAGGLWSLAALVTGFFVTRRVRSIAVVIGANVGFLLAAVSSYYLLAPTLDAYQNWYSARTVVFWLLVAGAVGVVNGLATGGLLSKDLKQWAWGVIVVASYLLFDWWRLVHTALASDIILQSVLVILLYTVAVFWFVLRTYRIIEE